MDISLLKRPSKIIISLKRIHFLLTSQKESFGLSEYINTELSRRRGFYKDYPCLDATYSLKDGSFIKARFIVKGRIIICSQLSQKIKTKRSAIFLIHFLSHKIVTRILQITPTHW